MFLRQMGNIITNKVQLGAPLYNLGNFMREYYNKYNKEELNHYIYMMKFYPKVGEKREKYIFWDNYIEMAIVRWEPLCYLYNHVNNDDCIFMPLDGTLFQNSNKNNKVLLPGEVSFIKKDVEHQIFNDEKKPICSLHIYHK